LKARSWFLTLSFYAILRSIPNKAGGIITMGGAIAVLLLIPFNNTSDIRNTTYRPIFKICYWVLIASWIVLTWIGQCPVEDIFAFVGQIATIYYYAFFIVLVPLVGKIESALAHYKVEKIESALAHYKVEKFNIPSFFFNFGVFLIHEILLTKTLTISLSVAAVLQLLIFKKFVILFILYGLIFFSIFLVLFLIVTFYHNSSLFDEINKNIEASKGRLVYKYWQDIKFRYFNEKLEINNTKSKKTFSQRRSYVTRTKPILVAEGTLTTLGSLAYQSLKASVGGKLVVVGQKVTTAGTKLAGASAKAKVTAAGVKVQKIGASIAASTSKTAGVPETLKLGADGVSATGTASLIIVGGTFFIVATGVDQVVRHKLETNVNVQQNPDYVPKEFKMKPPLEALMGKK
jgi:hypothetical protein